MVSLNLEKVGLFVLIAILVGGLATSPVFSSSYSAFAQEDDVDQEETDAMEEETDDFERDSVRYNDRECWETDDGQLRCEGHDGKCWRTDEGIRCEVEDDYKLDIKMILDKYCEMTDEERDEFLAEHDYFREYHERLANYCEMSEDERADYRETHHDMMMDFKEQHRDMLSDMKD